MSEPALIEMEKVTVYRGSNRALRDCDMRIEVGKNTAIVGPNGAGKSTLLKLLARELYPAEGRMEILGRQRWNVWELRKRLGIVSDDLQRNYSRSASGWAVVLSGFHSSNDIFRHQEFDTQMVETAGKWIRQLGIESLIERPFSAMSTGQQRRFLLARALVHDPQVLILDEPTAGLDLQAQFCFFNTVRQLMQSGKSVILVTHHVNEILPEIENVVLLKDGRVFEHGPKATSLQSAALSQLFETGLQVVENEGYYHVIPAPE